MVCTYGMSDRLGPISLSGRDGRAWWSEATGQAIDEEVQRILRTQYDYTLKLLKEHKDKLEALTEALLKEETLSAARAYEVVGLPLPVSIGQKLS
jgi:cell division protease FtsH